MVIVTERETLRDDAGRSEPMTGEGETMVTILTLFVTVFFAGMGLLALAAPERISAINGTPTLTPAGRNEVRAVYGGFGLAMTTILALAPFLPEIGRGVYVAVGSALGGMAGGRLVAAIFERPGQFYPSWFYCALETVMATVLFAAAFRA